MKLTMPNDCTNSLTISGITFDQWQDISTTFQVRQPFYQQDFLKSFSPEPDWQNIPNENGELPSALDENAISHFQDGTEDDRLYDWRCEHWGTKWDVYAVSNDLTKTNFSGEFNASFCTAWSPLGEKFMEVLSMYFLDSLLINCYEEFGADFFGVTIAKNGVVHDICLTMSEYRESFLRYLFLDLDAEFENAGLDLDDDLDEFFCEHCDLSDFSEFLRETQEMLVRRMTKRLA